MGGMGMGVCIDAENGSMTSISTPLPGTILPSNQSLIFSKEMTFDEWEEIGKRFGNGLESLAWYIGDWLVFGEGSFKKRVSTEAYEAAIKATGLAHKTLRNNAVVCRKFPPGKRVPGLSFGHHCELAAIPDDEREAWVSAIVPTSGRSAVPVARLRDSIRLVTGDPRIVSDDEVESQRSPSGIDNYGYHMVKLLAILRKIMPSASDDERRVLREDLRDLERVLSSA